MKPMEDYIVNDKNLSVWDYFIHTDLPRLSFYLTLFLIPIGIGACIMVSVKSKAY